MRFFEFNPILNEIKFTKKQQLDQAPFRKSDFNSPHIIDAIKAFCKDTGTLPEDVERAMHAHHEMEKLLESYSPLLRDVSSKNAAETVLWELVESRPEDVKRTEFKESTFIKFLKSVAVDAGLIPIESNDPKHKDKLVTRVNAILVPNKDPKYNEKYGHLTTAAVDSRGLFIFNRKFLQDLIYFADIINLVPRTSKPGSKIVYEAYGGEFPNGYAYIEFLILHELFHYIQGDVSRMIKEKEFSKDLHNWAQDFRINYELVKQGYTQLPMGLFSDGLNQDRFKNYRQLIEAVRDEYAKLPPFLQAWFGNNANIDDHTDAGSDQQQGKSKPWRPLLDDIVLISIDGTFGRVVGVKPNDIYEIEPMTIDEVKKEYPGLQTSSEKREL